MVVQPGAGWPILTSGRLERPTAVTDALGHFRVGGLPAGIVFVRVESQGFSPLEHGLLEPGSGPVTLLLPAGFRVMGKVQDPAGQPVHAAMVEIIQTQQTGTEDRRQENELD